jgi:hypothetical protein
MAKHTKKTRAKKQYPRYNFEARSKWSAKKRDAFELAGSTAQHTGLKPGGLWYSLYSAWANWGEVTHGKHVHKVTFVPNVHISWQPIQATPAHTPTHTNTNRIVVLRSFEDVRQFTQHYGGVMVCNKYANVRWKNVAKDYGGIELRNYASILKQIRKNNLRDTFLWYLSVDVSSGCVWNHALVKRVEYVFDKDE